MLISSNSAALKRGSGKGLPLIVFSGVITTSTLISKNSSNSLVLTESLEVTIATLIFLFFNHKSNS